MLTARLSPILGSSEGSASARELLCRALGMDLTGLVLHGVEPVEPAVAGGVVEWAERVAEGEPVQYVTGVAEFCGLDIGVAPGVLIPRPETEGLVSWAVEELMRCAAECRSRGGGGELRCLDLFTGSGCVALSVEAGWERLPEAGCGLWLGAVDVSPEALSQAAANGARRRSRVEWREADVLAASPSELGGPVEVLTANPPYVTPGEADGMSPNVLEHEPHLALFVPEGDPLLFHRRLGELACRGLLVEGGSLCAEVNAALTADVAELWQRQGLADVRILDDYLGRPRFVAATWLP